MKKNYPKHKEIKLGTELLEADGYDDHSYSSKGHWTAKNLVCGTSVTSSLKDPNLVTNIKQQLQKNIKKIMLDEVLPELESQFPNKKFKLNTNCKKIIDKEGTFTGIKDQPYYKFDITIEERLLMGVPMVSLERFGFDFVPRKGE